jgi:hypothetical protein
VKKISPAPAPKGEHDVVRQELERLRLERAKPGKPLRIRKPR